MFHMKKFILLDVKLVITLRISKRIRCAYTILILFPYVIHSAKTHRTKHKHEFDYDKTKILVTGTKRKQREIIEMFQIQLVWMKQDKT